MKNSMQIIISLGLAIALLSSQFVQAHGFMENPKARQQFCVEAGGYWWPEDGSAIPNLACRGAFLAKGTKAFVQNNEFSVNVIDYHNIEAVKLAIPDGQLCAGGDLDKSGIDIASPYWQRSLITPDSEGNVTVTFDAHTPHNPSFWEFYLSNTDFDAATETLSWQNLELIAEVSDVAVTSLDGRNVYQIRIPFPRDRLGAATLYTRWQREDAAGEGFYNCSDITIVNDTQPLDWTEIDQYIVNGLTANEGDEVWFRLFSSQGDELVFEKITVEQSNLATESWARQLSQQVLLQHSSQVRVGVKSQGEEIVYSDDLALNKVWVNRLGLTFRLDVKTPAEPPKTCTLSPWDESGTYNRGDLVVYESLSYQAKWWTQNELPSASGEWGVWKSLGVCQ
ncbi:MAG: lytic polysaccharide monooxygenase [Shewanella sp.]|nr:lytic polysaccharide monooxygenase [Shewanella sp.]